MGDSDPEESSDGTTESEAEWQHMDDFETDPPHHIIDRRALRVVEWDCADYDGDGSNAKKRKVEQSTPKSLSPPRTPPGNVELRRKRREADMIHVNGYDPHEDPRRIEKYHRDYNTKRTLYTKQWLGSLIE